MDASSAVVSSIVVSSIAVSFSVVVVGIEAVGSKFAFSLFRQNMGIFFGSNVFDLGRNVSTGLDEKGVPSLAGGELGPLKGPHCAEELEAWSSEVDENESVISTSC